MHAGVHIGGVHSSLNREEESILCIFTSSWRFSEKLYVKSFIYKIASRWARLSYRMNFALLWCKWLGEVGVAK